MLNKLIRSVGMATLLAASTALVTSNAQAQANPMAHIAASEATLSNFLRDPDMSWLQANIGRAKAIIISPEIVKAGFIFGGSGGRGMILAKDPKTGKDGMVLLGIDYQYCKGCLRCTHICKFGALIPAKEAEQDMDKITVKHKFLK